MYPSLGVRSARHITPVLWDFFEPSFQANIFLV